MTDSSCSKFYMIKTLNSGQISYGSMSLCSFSQKVCNSKKKLKEKVND